MQDNELCPIDAIVAYKLVRGIDSGQFFCDKNGNPLTKAHFIGKMRKALPAVGCSRINMLGIVSAVQTGLEDSTIKPLGRWNSLYSFRTYVL